MVLYQIRRAKRHQYSIIDGIIHESESKRDIMKRWRNEGYQRECEEAAEHGYEPSFALYKVTYELIAGDGYLK